MRDFYITQRGKETKFFASFTEMMNYFGAMSEADQRFSTIHDDTTGMYASGYDIVGANGKFENAFKYVA